MQIASSTSSRGNLSIYIIAMDIFHREIFHFLYDLDKCFGGKHLNGKTFFRVVTFIIPKESVLLRRELSLYVICKK